MNLNPWKNDQIEPHGNGEYMILASNIKDLSPHFLPIMGGKMGQYSLQNKIWNLPDRSTILRKFIYDKEGKLAKSCRTDPNFGGQCPRSATYFEDCQYPPKMGKWAISPLKRGKTGGIRNIFSIFIYKFWTFFCHLPIPPKWGDS